ALRSACPDFGKRPAHTAQRFKADQDGDRVDRDHADAEHDKGDVELLLEFGDVGLEFAAIAHDAKPRDAVLAVEDELALEYLDRLAREPRRHIAALEFGVERHLVAGRRFYALCQR